ncbi:MAG TPA: MopE-related protein [Chitinophagales bacterium]|nr:T9SS type A sorting domain-containing protein [Chitinophagales bacterium]HMZ89396.1 MopE-related protein [Chitinophagales bacterium]HNF68713.1 MopE-related protein [Chitinophagales bacterium]HNI54631.1 MopE-related protein [Chitinophagales bacterium]HNJ89493.1 MopE-related protein [Chitinophagales bacterium]
MKRLHTLLLAVVVACSSTAVHAQIYSYTNDLSGTPSGIAANATGTNLSRINGTLETTACPDGFNSSQWSKSTLLTPGKPAVEFSATPDAGFQLDVTSISADIRINPKGPTIWRIAYSADGGATWITNPSDIIVESTTCDFNTNISFDVDDFSTTNTVMVRLYGLGAHSSLNGKAVIRNAMIDGSVVDQDLDGDGYGFLTDCDDTNPDINPGATEICNGMDDNCNGDIDEGLTFTTYYADMDGDGYGDAGMSATTCDGTPDGYVMDATDCNDADAAVNPGATEICNDVDDNCDGNIDEGLAVVWYADMDGDGYGDATMMLEDCAMPEGYVMDATDCNDADAAVNPGMTEVCGNGIDDNCDGNIDESDVAASFEVIGDNPTCEGTGTYFMSTATGMDITYQWYRNMMPIAGATGATYTPANAGYYQLEVSNGVCSDMTDTVHVIIKQAPEPELYMELGTDVCVNGFVKIKVIPNPGTGSTYVWYYNGDVLAGATTELVETTDAGTYYCVVTGPNGCSGTSEVVTVTADCRLAGTENGTLAVYPNPAKGNFTMQLNNAPVNGEAVVHITDMTGRVVYAVNTTIVDGQSQMNVSLENNIASGMYMVTVQTQHQIWNAQISIVK